MQRGARTRKAGARGLAFSADQAFLYSAGHDGAILVWSMKNLAQHGRLSRRDTWSAIQAVPSLAKILAHFSMPDDVSECHSLPFPLPSLSQAKTREKCK